MTVDGIPERKDSKMSSASPCEHVSSEDGYRDEPSAEETFDDHNTRNSFYYDSESNAEENNRNDDLMKIIEGNWE